MSTPATVVISQTNLVGAVITDGIANLSLGSADIPNMVAADHPLVLPVAGNIYSYEVYTRWKVTAWVDTNLIDNLKWFKSAGSNAANWIERHSSIARAYATPLRTISNCDGFAWPTTAGTAITITGSIATPTIGYNGNAYAVHQVGIDNTVVSGAKGSHTITYRYDES